MLDGVEGEREDMGNCTTRNEKRREGANDLGRERSMLTCVTQIYVSGRR